MGYFNNQKQILGYVVYFLIIFASYLLGRFDDVGILLIMLASFLLSQWMMEDFRPIIKRILKDDFNTEIWEIIITYIITIILFLSIELIFAKQYSQVLIVVLALIISLIYIFRYNENKNL